MERNAVDILDEVSRLINETLNDYSHSRIACEAIRDIMGKVYQIKPFNRPTWRFIVRCVDLAVRKNIADHGTRPVMVYHFLIFVREIMVKEGFDAESVQGWTNLDKNIVAAIKQHSLVNGLRKGKGTIVGNEIVFLRP